MVDHLVPAAEFGVFVAQCIKCMRIAGDNSRDTQSVEGFDQRCRQLLEQHLVAGATHAFPGRRFGHAKDAEADPGLAQDCNNGARDSLAARVEGFGGSHVIQVVEVLYLLWIGDDRDAQVPCPVRARVGGEPPRIAL
jgi:hypothetical protein